MQFKLLKPDLYLLFCILQHQEHFLDLHEKIILFALIILFGFKVSLEQQIWVLKQFII